MNQPLILLANTAPIIYLSFLKSPVWKKAILFQKTASINFSFLISLFIEVTFFIVKKPLLFPTNTFLIIYFSFLKSPVWNQALLFQKSVFPTCISFSCFNVKTFNHPNKHRPYNLLFISKKSLVFKDRRLFLYVSTELF